MADPGTRFLGRGKPGRREQPAHESLSSRVTLAEVPLTGLSFTTPRAKAWGPPTDWVELVQVHNDRAIFQASPDEPPVIDVHSL